MVDSWLRALEQAGQVISQPVVDEDAAAQARLRELFPDDALYGDSGTGGVRTYTPEQQAENRRAFASFIFGPERGSIFGGEASRPERVVRDWIFSEQEFRTSSERFEQGSWRAGFGWGALGLAGVIPIAGDAAQVAGRLGRAAEAAGDVARAAETAGDVARAGDTASDVGRLSETAGGVARVAETAADVAPQVSETTDLSRVIGGGDVPAPITQSDADILNAMGSDPVLATSSQPPFVSSANLDEPLWESGQVASNAQDIFNVIERDAGVVLPESVKEEIFGRYGGSFIRIDPEYSRSAFERASELVSDIDNFAEWDRPYQVTGLSGTTEIVAPYSPTRGIAPDVEQGLTDKGIWYSNYTTDPENIASALRFRAQLFADAHNRIVVDNIFDNFARAGIDIRPGSGGLRYNVEDWGNAATAFNEFGVRPTIAVPGLVVQQVLDQGAIFNQYMTMSSRGALSPVTRINTDLASFGILPRVGPMGRPVYGYLTVSDEVMEQFVGSLSPVIRESLGYGRVMQIGVAEGYGDVHFVFGDATRQQSTFTWGDSLNRDVIGRPVADVSPGDVGLSAGSRLDTGPRGSGLRPDIGMETFIESQIIQPDLSDVTEIHVLDGIYARSGYIDNLREGMRALTGRDVDIYIREPAPIGYNPEGYAVMGYRSRLTYPGGRQVENPLRGDLPDWGQR